MNEMIERVRLAIEMAYAPAVNAKSPYAKFMSEKAARDALAALRDPTQAMLEAGNEAGLSNAALFDDTRFACERATYVAMINAAELI